MTYTFWLEGNLNALECRRLNCLLRKDWRLSFSCSVREKANIPFLDRISTASSSLQHGSQPVEAEIIIRLSNFALLTGQRLTEQLGKSLVAYSWPCGPHRTLSLGLAPPARPCKPSCSFSISPRLHLHSHQALPLLV